MIGLVPYDAAREHPSIEMQYSKFFRLSYGGVRTRGVDRRERIATLSQLANERP